MVDPIMEPQRDKFLDDMAGLVTMKQMVDYMVRVTDYMGKGGKIEPHHWIGLGMRLRELDRQTMALQRANVNVPSRDMGAGQFVSSYPDTHIHQGAKMSASNTERAPIERVQQRPIARPGTPGHLPRVSIDQLGAPTQSGVDGDFALNEGEDAPVQDTVQLPPLQRPTR